MSFENTIDTLGDDICFQNIVEKNISEFYDDKLKNIGNFAFYSCPTIKTVNLPSATGIGYAAFYNCFALTEANLPAVTNIGTNAFTYCYSLTTANIPEAANIGISAFHGCNNLRSALINTTTTVRSNAFRGCAALASIALRATKIEESAFLYCTSLTIVSLAEATKISSFAFASTNLQSLYLLGGLATLNNSNAFNGTPLLTTGTIYVPANLISTYQSASNWSYFSSRFSAFVSESS